MNETHDINQLAAEVQPAPTKKEKVGAFKAKNAKQYKVAKKPLTESKRALFVRVANRRVRKAIAAIRLIANMGDTRVTYFKAKADFYIK